MCKQIQAFHEEGRRGTILLVKNSVEPLSRGVAPRSPSSSQTSQGRTPSSFPHTKKTTYRNPLGDHLMFHQLLLLCILTWQMPAFKIHCIHIEICIYYIIHHLVIRVKILKIEIEFASARSRCLIVLFIRYFDRQPLLYQCSHSSILQYLTTQWRICVVSGMVRERRNYSCDAFNRTIVILSSPKSYHY